MCGVRVTGMYADDRPLALVCTWSCKNNHQSILASADLICNHREFLTDSLQYPKCSENLKM